LSAKRSLRVSRIEGGGEEGDYGFCGGGPCMASPVAGVKVKVDARIHRALHRRDASIDGSVSRALDHLASLTADNGAAAAGPRGTQPGGPRLGVRAHPRGCCAGADPDRRSAPRARSCRGRRGSARAMAREWKEAAKLPDAHAFL
jgi:hypothetical protein